MCLKDFLMKKENEIVEDWEVEYGVEPHRFPYKDLVRATGGFNEKKVVGEGRYNKVFKGVLPHSKDQIALKRVFDKPSTPIKENTIALVGTISRLHHPNLLGPLGYNTSSRGQELLLDL
ncbi:hypothetical protein COLO4_24087 [Corchorus olitorius]|uniref:Protein kinase domain-containing protein n=1 Tax=Corchorus olitorius TaxID=93759 RepID=A0A1R3ID27_9ROSI|nr:hypothetical protein COLO4_24087 [Corchorus olitorius]